MATAERDTESTFDLVKRVVVGRRMATHRLEHTLLPKILALPVFSSDPLSSVAYATEESLRVLLAASAAAFTLVMPISITIAALFVIPTYGFVASIYVLLAVGLSRCLLSGCPHAVVPHDVIALGPAGAGVSLFIILHAFSSGSTALTGVEAISNGVPAFRRPQSRNAAATLGIMGVISITMFLGISFLAQNGRAIPSETKSVVAQIADGVFHGGFFYYGVQVFTAAILILAANTSYQDFPRLSSILARDKFLPRQFENRGDRLVFSNGVIVLAVLASILIYVFNADLSRLIQLYVVGVFTSFTLSQSGMVRHWLKVRRVGDPDASRGWKRSIVINGVGAVATGVVLVIVVETKF